MPFERLTKMKDWNEDGQDFDLHYSALYHGLKPNWLAFCLLPIPQYLGWLIHPVPY